MISDKANTMILQKEIEKHADGSLWYDLDILSKEEVEVLQQDKTWKHFAGPKFQVCNVAFDGKPEEVAAEMQKLRDEATWGNHAIVQAVYVYPLTDGKVRYISRMWLTDIERETSGPLPRVDLLVLREIGRFLTHTMIASEEIILGLIEKSALTTMKEEEDKRFFQWMNNILEATKRIKSETP